MESRCRKAGRPLGGFLKPGSPEWNMLGDKWMALGFSSDDPVNMQGIHAPGGVLLIMDEGNGVHPDIWNALHGVLVGEHDRMLVIANPTESSGPFFELWGDPECVKFTISAVDTPNVKEGRTVIPGMIGREWVEDRRKAWGEDSVLFKSRVLAQFPDSSDDALIPLSWMDIAHQRWDQLTEEDAWGTESWLGLDVARTGDNTVAARAYDCGIRDLHRFRHAPGTETAGWAIRLFKDLGCRSLRVDADGLGSTIFDLIEESLKEKAFEMHFGGSTKDPDRFFNAKAEWMWHMRCLLDPSRDGGSIALPRDDRLATQLTSCRWTQDKRGRIQIEPKEDLKKRIGHSPDEMDAVVYALARMEWTHQVSVDPELGYRASPWAI
jgi:hypothetical protein